MTSKKKNTFESNAVQNRFTAYAEIAERLHIKEVSCRSRLVRAKAHFAELRQKEKIL